MKLLLFSDVHCDLDAARRLVALADDVDVVVAAGDFASQHRGLEETIAALRPITRPVVVIPGNNERPETLRLACREWASARVLHLESAEIDGVSFYGLGGGIPTTPWDWSFDLEEAEAESALRECPPGGVLVSHSPPRGHVDTNSDGRSLGSTAVRAAIDAKRPRLVVCGHIHDSWEQRSKVGPTSIVNAGPRGVVVDLDACD